MFAFVDRMLSRTEIEVLVQSGMPSLFKNGEESARRMRVFLGSEGSNVSYMNSFCTF